MRRLAADELRSILERGILALDSLNVAAEFMESLALEVSERRLADAELAAGLASLGLTELRRIYSAVRAAKAGVGEG